MDGNVTRRAREYFDGEENAPCLCFFDRVCIANIQRGEEMAEGGAHLHAKIRIAFRKIDNAIEILFPSRYFDTSVRYPSTGIRFTKSSSTRYYCANQKPR